MIVSRRLENDLLFSEIRKFRQTFRGVAIADAVVQELQIGGDTYRRSLRREVCAAEAGIRSMDHAGGRDVLELFFVKSDDAMGLMLCAGAFIISGGVMYLSRFLSPNAEAMARGEMAATHKLPVVPESTAQEKAA